MGALSGWHCPGLWDSAVIQDTLFFPSIVRSPSFDEFSHEPDFISLVFLLTTRLFHSRFSSFLKFCGTAALSFSFFILISQCTWTPEVETPIHHSQQGRIVLQTSSALNAPPKHPQILSESLITQILQGITKTQERGMLQELFTSNPAPRQAFSPAQIDFLAPQLVNAFSQATAEEIVTFQCTGDNEGASQVSGTVAAFSPAIFFLTLKNPEDYQGNPSKIASSSRNLQKPTTLLFSEKQAILPPEEAHRLRKTSAKDSWIAINYATTSPATESDPEEARSTPPIASPESEKSQPAKNSLQEQLRDLRERVDEQAEEIQRLQQAAPK